MKLISDLDLSMLPVRPRATLTIRKVMKEEVMHLAANGRLRSYIHDAELSVILYGERVVGASTTEHLSELMRDESVYVAKYVGPPIPKGVYTLPEGSRIDYYMIHIF